GDRAHAGGGDHAPGAALEPGQGLAQQVAGGIAAAGVVVAALVAEAVEAEVAREHQRWRDRTVGGVAVDARAHRAGGRAAVAGGGEVAGVHAESPGWRSTPARMASMRSISFRKASWP